MLDLSGVTRDVYADVQRVVSVPALGSQASPQPAGRVMIVAHRVTSIGGDDMPINIGRYMFEAAGRAFEGMRAGDL